jgi:integrase
VPEPYYKQSRDTWYVEIDGRQHSLGRHPEGAPPPRKGKKGKWNTPQPILDAYCRFMAERQDKAPLPPEPEGEDAASVIEKYLAWCCDHRAPATYEWYRWRLQLFADTLPDKRLPVPKLRHFHLDELLGRHRDWSSGMKHSACRAVMRCFRWAKKKGHVEVNPFADYEKPPAGKRNVVICPERFTEILSLTPSPNFRDLLEVTWATGCRPQESLAVEARHVDLPNTRWFFPPDESKGEEWPRVVYLDDRALEITRRLMAERPAGPLFRNDDGKPWDPFAVNCAFCRLQVRMGQRRMKELGVSVDPVPRFNRHAFEDKAAMLKARAEHKQRLYARKKQVHRLACQHAPKYCLYHLRHSWLDRALKRGLDVLTCAILMGHRDPSTISKVYQHVSQSPEYLREAAKRAAG